MYLAYPAALWLGLGAIVPVLLHLLAQARPRPLRFPGAYLLRRMEAQRRSLRLRHLMLLALRVLCLLLLAVACAGPRVTRALPLLAEPTECVVLLDASASMRKDATTWSAALEAARRLVDADGGPETGVLVAPGLRDVEEQGGAVRGQALADVQPTWRQAAVAEDARAAAAGIAEARRQAHLVVLTDLDASSLLPRTWPPEPLASDATVADCAPPERPRAVYAARLSPADPPAQAPVEITAQALGGKAGTVRVEMGGGLSAAGELGGARGAVSVVLGKLPPGEREIALATDGAADFRLAAHVREGLGVWVEAPMAARRYLEAAVDPSGGGRPLRLAARPDEAEVVLAVAAGDPPGQVRSALRGASLVLFALGERAMRQWLGVALDGGDPGLRADAPTKLPADRAERLTFPLDAPPAVLSALGELRTGVEDCRVFQPVPLHGSRDWHVLGRFSDGSAAMVLRQETRRQVLVVGLAPEPEATDLVSAGVFPALLHALIPRVAPPATTAPEALPIGGAAWSALVAGAEPSAPTTLAVAEGRLVAANPPPSEAAGLRLGPEEIRQRWGARTRVVAASELLAGAPPARLSDLVALVALALLAAAAGEWLLAGSMSAPAEEEAP